MNKLRRIKDYILKIINQYERYYYKKGTKKKIDFHYIKGKKKIFFFMTPGYGNLGDQAIEVATDKFLSNFFSDYIVEKIHLGQAYEYMSSVEDVIADGDIVLLQGGGNFGSLYPDIERERRFIVSKLKNNKIFLMPSSIEFENNSAGSKELLKSKKIYKENTNFIIVLRDKYSKENADKYFPENKNYLYPDMALFLKEFRSDVYKETKDHKLIIVCLRNDKESAIQGFRTELLNKIQSKYNDVFFYDTRVERDIIDEVKESEIYSVLNLFKNAKFVVTDRLHAMIFSAIANTPCLVMSSIDKKIEGMAAWMKGNAGIKFVKAKNAEELISFIEKIQIIHSINISENHEFLELYRDLAGRIREEDLS